MALPMFIESLDRFTNALGVENAPAVVHLSLVPWPDSATRDAFIKELTGWNPGANV